LKKTSTTKKEIETEEECVWVRRRLGTMGKTGGEERGNSVSNKLNKGSSM